MYGQIGKKIKTLAEVVAIIGIIINILLGIILAVVVHSFLLFLLISIIGSLLCWISGFFVYGFGELIDKTSAIAQHMGASPEESYHQYTGYTTNTLLFSRQQNSNDNEQTIKKPDTAKSIPIQPDRQAGANEWKCPTCGKINQNYVGTCGCGTLKPPSQTSINLTNRPQDHAQAVNTAQSYCRNCQYPIQEGARFCTRCGTEQ